MLTTDQSEFMAQDYDFTQRWQNIAWYIETIDVLIQNANVKKCPSFLIYACLESRNLIERIEFEMILMTANESLSTLDFEIIKNRHGIQKANKMFNALKRRYQLFTESYVKAIGSELKTKAYEYNMAEKIKTDLSQYIHIYSRTDQELCFDSQFIKDGFSLIVKTTDFVREYVKPTTDGFILCVLDFHSLREPVKSELKAWVSGNEKSNVGLTERLLRIVNAPDTRDHSIN